jgi:methionine salvage enolase-phosphatase E1
VLRRISFDSSFFISFRNKRETCSYVEITESLGVDKPSEILFVTDVYQEAVAAKAAGNDLFVKNLRLCLSSILKSVCFFF